MQEMHALYRLNSRENNNCYSLFNFKNTDSKNDWLHKNLAQYIHKQLLKLGAYSRSDKLTKEDFEMLVIAEK